MTSLASLPSVDVGERDQTCHKSHKYNLQQKCQSSKFTILVECETLYLGKYRGTCRSRSICCHHSLGARLSRMAEIYGKTSGNECNVSYMYVVLHAPDLRYGRQIDIHIRCTVPYSTARETTTSVGLAHARPISPQSKRGIGALHVKSFCIHVHVHK